MVLEGFDRTPAGKHALRRRNRRHVLCPRDLVESGDGDAKLAHEMSLSLAGAQAPPVGKTIADWIDREKWQNRLCTDPR
jgi:hypothetical protein